VRIVDIRETVVPIKSQIRNAFIDFSQMTVSVLALLTDVVRDGKPIVGFGFNSNGRYAPSGLLRERFIPRLKTADSESLLNDARDNLDPARVWDVLMRNEKPGGHGERSVAVGVLDMACGMPPRKTPASLFIDFSPIAIVVEKSTPKYLCTPPADIFIPARI